MPALSNDHHRGRAWRQNCGVLLPTAITILAFYLGMIEPYADVPPPIGFPDPGKTTYPESGAADEIGDVQV
jgi:hypothetical protein